jgi:hypothetical protein
VQQQQQPQAPPPASEQELGPQPAMQEYRIQTTLSKGWLEKQSGGKKGERDWSVNCTLQQDLVRGARVPTVVWSAGSPCRTAKEIARR